MMLPAIPPELNECIGRLILAEQGGHAHAKEGEIDWATLQACTDRKCWARKIPEGALFAQILVGRRKVRHRRNLLCQHEGTENGVVQRVLTLWLETA